MKLTSFFTGIILFLLITFSYSNAQTPSGIPKDLTDFFVGNWHGEGAFSSGKKIAADLSVKLTLNKKWCVFEHQDVPPNPYQAVSWLGMDQLQKQLFCETFDNFSGHRSFLINKWAADQLIIMRKVENSKMLYFERFVYKKDDPKLFFYSYQTSADSLKWHTVDSLAFKRVL